MKLLITGKNGQLGQDLVRVLSELGEVIATDRKLMDLSQPDTVAAVVRDVKPSIIVNAGAYTGVDKAEAEPALARAVNATAPGVLAEEARKLGALLIHYSTDYVFDGRKSSPYVETDLPRPLNVYGASKWEGERAVFESGCRSLILRTSWVYSPHGSNFMLTMRRLLGERQQVSVVVDQVGAPTPSHMIAEATAHALRQKELQYGLYHLTASGHTSWHDFAKLISRYVPPPVAYIAPVRASEFSTAAVRPLNSRLDCTKFKSSFGFPLPHWENEASAVLHALRQEQ